MQKLASTSPVGVRHRLLRFPCHPSTRPRHDFPRCPAVTTCSLASNGSCSTAGATSRPRPGRPTPGLSGAFPCGSRLMRSVFGPSIRSHFQRQHNRIGGCIVDLSHDARDVGRMSRPHRHERGCLQVPDVQSSLSGCLRRAGLMAGAFSERGASCRSHLHLHSGWSRRWLEPLALNGRCREGHQMIFSATHRWHDACWTLWQRKSRNSVASVAVSAHVKWPFAGGRPSRWSGCRARA